MEVGAIVSAEYLHDEQENSIASLCLPKPNNEISSWGNSERAAWDVLHRKTKDTENTQRIQIEKL